MKHDEIYAMLQTHLDDDGWAICNDMYDPQEYDYDEMRISLENLSVLLEKEFEKLEDKIEELDLERCEMEQRNED